MARPARTAPPGRDQIAHLRLDMREAGAGDRAVAACLDRHGRLDVLVNNVGSGRIVTGFTGEPDKSWQKFWELNFMSAVRTTRSALPHLMRERGVVINVSSINRHLPYPDLYSYNASEAAMDRPDGGPRAGVRATWCPCRWRRTGPGHYTAVARAGRRGRADLCPGRRCPARGHCGDGEGDSAGPVRLHGGGCVRHRLPRQPPGGFGNRDDPADRRRSHPDALTPAVSTEAVMVMGSKSNALGAAIVIARPRRRPLVSRLRWRPEGWLFSLHEALTQWSSSDQRSPALLRSAW
jgi:hypothetical protein